MNKNMKECPDCDRANPSELKKCKYCGAVMHYGRDYYKFKNFLSWTALVGTLSGLIYWSLSESKLIDSTFIDNLPNWVSYIFWGLVAFSYLCLFLVRLADLDETFNE